MTALAGVPQTTFSVQARKETPKPFTAVGMKNTVSRIVNIERCLSVRSDMMIDS